jgi:hypothetical protein
MSRLRKLSVTEITDQYRTGRFGIQTFPADARIIWIYNRTFTG